MQVAVSPTTRLSRKVKRASKDSPIRVTGCGMHTSWEQRTQAPGASTGPVVFGPVLEDFCLARR